MTKKYRKSVSAVIVIIKGKLSKGLHLEKKLRGHVNCCLKELDFILSGRAVWNRPSQTKLGKYIKSVTCKTEHNGDDNG